MEESAFDTLLRKAVQQTTRREMLGAVIGEVGRCAELGALTLREFVEPHPGPGPLVMQVGEQTIELRDSDCLLYTSPSPRDRTRSRMPSSA